MKKVCLFFIALLIMPTVASAATELYVGNSYPFDLSSATPAHGGVYYKCTSPISYTCESPYIKITYTGQSGNHSGTTTDPILLTGCTFVSCACGWTTRLSGKTCINCDTNAYASRTETHTNETCSYCEQNYYLSSNARCELCPLNGTTSGITNEGITACCYGSWQGSDDTGYFNCTSNGCYQQN